MTILRRGLLALAVSAGMVAGAALAAAEGLGKGKDLPHAASTWAGLYGGVHIGHADVGNFDDGFLGGVLLGRNWQSGLIVYGLEADISLSGMDHVDWIATIRGRVGYLISPNILLYGTAGLGLVDFGSTETDLVYGAGIEGKLTPTTTLRLEYLGFADTDISVVRVGLAFKLNW